jgi:hypothetical protein
LFPFLIACSPDEQEGIPLLGSGTHDVASVDLAWVVDESDGLTDPRDIGFEALRPGEMWVVNGEDDSVVIVTEAHTDAPTARKVIDPFAMHFMDNVASIAMGHNGFFATCQESTNTYNGTANGNNFMGPTLWSTDPATFGKSNPVAVEYLTDLFGFRVDLGSHLDMLHDTPLCMGIAWEADNVYWTFDGNSSSISRQDFKVDHGHGFDEHGDGEILRYVEGEVSRVEDVPSHLEYDPDTALLYVADTGNGRIAVLDTTTGTVGSRLPQVDATPYPVHNRIDGAVLTTLVDELDRPSGLALLDGVIYVTEEGSGVISAYDEAGTLIDWLDTGLGAGALNGLEFDHEGNLYFTDGSGLRVGRLRTPEPSSNNRHGGH